MGAREQSVRGDQEFPGLEELKACRRPRSGLSAVHVEEVLFELGRSTSAGARRTSTWVWRDAMTKQILIGEFSFETHFRRYGKLEPQPKLRSERFSAIPAGDDA